MEKSTKKTNVSVATAAPEAKTPTTIINSSDKNDNKSEHNRKDASNHVTSIKNSNQPVENKSFEERVIGVKRISKTTKGGRIMRFSALVVIGDKNGTVGFGMGKSNEVPDAIKKAIKNANNNLFTVKMNKRGTLYHEVQGRHGAAKVMLKPAGQGRGIIAGGSVRAVVELLGFKDISAKSMGSNTPINVIRATINGLSKQVTPSEVAKARDKDIKAL